MQNDELLAATRELIRYALLTMASMRDPDRKHLGLAQMPQYLVRDINEAYGYSSAKARSFQPSAQHVSQAEYFEGWLSWLRRQSGEGDISIRRLTAWAMGVPLWKIGQKEGCSPDTVMNRINRSIALMLSEFAKKPVPIAVVEEPYNGADYGVSYEKPSGPHGGSVLIQKVYVADKGFMRGGKKLRNGRERFRESA